MPVFPFVVVLHLPLDAFQIRNQALKRAAGPPPGSQQRVGAFEVKVFGVEIAIAGKGLDPFRLAGRGRVAPILAAGA